MLYGLWSMEYDDALISTGTVEGCNKPQCKHKHVVPLPPYTRLDKLGLTLLRTTLKLNLV